ncbi:MULTISPECIES: hypothetical protein [Odoribacteraceae]|uniref:hypothetical protein n=1 Tax=Odoribacteraceae TaxID=1853231 RepID=UPI000E4D8D03|nr:MULTISPECIES: hypothetical protein [Odoribacteraceae]MCQ4874010.1 hypothetical protein [Butyricimonas paravirosa]RHR82954.1 hypothetical protein DWW52_03595 [Odoribacter sp. AF15-53]
MNINQILLISHYEAKVLRRNWLFIFLVVLLVVGSLAAQWFIQVDIPIHFLKALSCSVPFVSAFLFNFIQGIFIIFIAGDFIRRDRSLDSFELLSTRSHGNGDYAMGKLLAVVGSFVVLNVLVIVITWGFHQFSMQSSPVFFPYVFYFMTLTLPSLLFLVGITLWITVTIKIWPMALLCLIGYIFFNVFVLTDYLYGSLDYLAISQPNVFSDATGKHVGFFPYLAQRIAFAMLGIAFMFLSVVRLKRLPNDPGSKRWIQLIGFIVLIAGIWIGGTYYSHFEKDRQKRQEFVKLYMEYAARKRMEITRQHIVYNQHRTRMIVNDTLTIRNPYREKISEFFLFLNPGLYVDDIKTGETNVNFTRKDFVISLHHSLNPGETKEFVIRYTGEIDERVCYLDIPDQEYYATQWSINILRYGKHTALVDDEYTLLTPECLWYPTVEFQTSPVSLQFADRYFTDYVLTVIHDPSYTVISQGEASQTGYGTRFDNAHGLPGLTLCMGIYNKREITIDSTRFELYYFDEKGALFSSLEATREGLVQGLGEAKTYFEKLTGEVYPFHKLAFIEIPVSFCAYRGENRKRSERVQPELIFKLENCCDQSDYLPLKEYADKREKNVSGRSRAEIESEAIRNFCTANVGEEISVLKKMTLPDFLAGQQVTPEIIKNPASILPMFTDFSGYTYSENFPGIDRIMTGMQANNQVDIQWELYKIGENGEHKAIRALSSRSLRDVLKETEKSCDLNAIFKLKAAYLRKQINIKVNQDSFAVFMKNFRSRNSFSCVAFECLSEEFKREFDFDLVETTRELYDQHGLAAFYIQDIEQYMGVGNEEPMLAFSVWNSSDVNGIISAYTDKGDDSRDLLNVGDFMIRAGECSRIYFPLPHCVRGVILQTNLARNIPGNYIRNFMEYPQEAVVHEGREKLNPSCFLPSSGEIVVDNEDRGFHVLASETKESLLGKLLQDNMIVEDRGVDFLTDNAPGWISSVYIDAYGFPVRSFLGKKIKNSQARAEWKTEIPEQGEYELSIYKLDLDFRYQRQADSVAYYYTLEQGDYRADIVMSFLRNGQQCIHLSDNLGRKEEYSFQQQMPQCSWIQLGIYSLAKGKVKLVLHDKGVFPGQLIFADAVKWVKK